MRKAQLLNMPLAPSEKSTEPPPASPELELTLPLAKVMPEAVRLPELPVTLKCLVDGADRRVTPTVRLEASSRSRRLVTL